MREKLNDWLESKSRLAVAGVGATATAITTVFLVLVLEILLDCLKSKSGFWVPLASVVTAVATVTLCIVTGMYVRVTNRMAAQSVRPVITLKRCSSGTDGLPACERIDDDTQRNNVNMLNVGSGPALSVKLTPWVSGRHPEHGWVQAWWAHDPDSVKTKATVVSPHDQTIPKLNCERVEVTIHQDRRAGSKGDHSPIHIFFTFKDAEGLPYRYQCDADLNSEGAITIIYNEKNLPANSVVKEP